MGVLGYQKVPDERFLDCAARGLTRVQAAAELRVSLPTITRWRKKHPKVKWKDHRSETQKARMADPAIKARHSEALREVWAKRERTISPAWAARKRRLAMAEAGYGVIGHDRFTEAGFARLLAQQAAKDSLAWAVQRQVWSSYEPDHEWWLDQDDSLAA